MKIFDETFNKHFGWYKTLKKASIQKNTKDLIQWHGNVKLSGLHIDYTLSIWYNKDNNSTNKLNKSFCNC